MLTRGRTLNFPEGPLVVLVRVLLAGVLATPLVVWDELIYPYVLPKALYSRVLIALAFAVWAVLAAARPAWRPPRSALLLLVGVGAAVAVVATPFGVSPRYSVWSDYGRMEGLFDLAHWVAFAVVAASVLRTERDWWLMLNGFVAVGLLLAGHAIVQVLRAPGPLDPTMHVVGAMGNPAYLGAMLQAVALLAAGLLGASLVRRQRDRRTLTLLARAFPVVALVAAICGLLLSGSKGAFLGFFAGAAVGVFAFACAVGGPPARRLVLVAVAMLTAPALLLGGAFAWRAASDEDSLADRVPLIWRATDPFELGLSVHSRLENWRAGAAAFAERPLLGWGPGNYMPAGAAHTSADAGRHLPNRGAINEAQDHAHNVLIEEAVTKGVPGVLAYLALWVWTGVVAWRALRAARGGDRILVATVCAALAGWFVQSQTLFYFGGAWLAHMLLLAFLARREAGLAPTADAPARAAPPLAWRRATAASAAAALAAASIAANAATYVGGAALYRAAKDPPEVFMASLKASIDAFEPMATHVRMLLLMNVAWNWKALLARDREEALRLLSWCDDAAARALAAEPRNWRLHHALARLYAEVGRSDPAYRPLARQYLRSSREVAPNLDPTLPFDHGGR